MSRRHYHSAHTPVLAPSGCWESLQIFFVLLPLAPVVFKITHKLVSYRRPNEREPYYNLINNYRDLIVVRNESKAKLVKV